MSSDTADVVVAETLYSATQRGRFTVAQVAGIEKRTTHYDLPWWRRWREPRPPQWGQEE